MTDRKVVFKALVGSHNYNLNTQTSDYDYKVFVFPTFDDLYYGKMHSNQIITTTEDNNVHDIRKLGELLWKANINFVEVMFSKNITFGSGNDDKEIFSIFDMKNDLARMNLPYLFNACIGMHYEKVKHLETGTSGTMYLVEKFGFDSKQAQHAYRVLDFLDRFAKTDFNDFASAMAYEPTDAKLLFSIKDGFYLLNDMKQLLADKLAWTKENLEKLYLSQKPDEETRNTLNELIKSLVKHNLEL